MAVTGNTAVLVVDMLNDYLSPDGLLVCATCRSVIEPILRLLTESRRRGWPVIYVNTALNRIETPLAQRWGMHAQPDTWGAQVVEELAPQEIDVIVRKQSYDGFYMTDLDGQLRTRSVQRVLVCGIHTHVCVLLTAVGAFNRGYDVVVLEDCITTEKPENHISRLPFFMSHVGQLLRSQEILAQ